MATLKKVHITADDRGPIVNIVGWLCIVTTILAILTRLLLRLTTTGRINKDDALVGLGMALAITHTLILSLQVTNGLGRRQDSLSDSELDAYQRAGYASQFFFITAVTCSKLSTTILLYDLTPAKKWRMATRIFGISILAWNGISIICISFQCPLLDSWRILNVDRKCLNQPAFWTSITVFDIIQEIFMLVIPVLLVRNLCMTISRKLVVVFAFSFRLLVVAMSIVRIHYIQKMTNNTFDAHMNAIFTQLVVCISLTVSCIPFLKSVMENLQSGLLANHGQHGLISGKNGSGQSPSGSYALRNFSASGKASKQVSVQSLGRVDRVAPMSHSSPELWEEGLYAGPRGRLDINVERSVQVTTETTTKDDDESLNSLTGSERRILGNSARNKVTVESGN